MARKKRRKRRHKKRNTARLTRPYIKDCHHILWQKSKWTHGYVLKLRNYDYCRIYIPRDTLHRFIHSQIKEIPVPREMDAESALEQLKYLEEREAISSSDPLEKRLIVLIALFDCASQSTADALREQLEIVRGYNNPL